MISELSILALQLEDGENCRDVCPFCDAVHEKSLSLSRVGQVVLYKCFRASCNRKGAINIRTGHNLSSKKKPRKITEFTRQLTPLTEEEYATLQARYSLTKREVDLHGLKSDKEVCRLWLPIRDYFGREIAGHSKDLNYIKGDPVPKSISYWGRYSGTKLHYVNSQGGREVVLVEDILSAMKVGRYAPCVALLGTNISDEIILALKKNYDSIVIALDEDATDRAWYFKKKYGLVMPIKVAPLQRDPKDMSEQEIKEIILCR